MSTEPAKKSFPWGIVIFGTIAALALVVGVVMYKNRKIIAAGNSTAPSIKNPTPEELPNGAGRK